MTFTKITKRIHPFYLILFSFLFFQNISCDDLNHAEQLSIKRYQLPEDHPIKEKLDEIFTKTRVTLNENEFLNAGFVPIVPIRTDKIVIARHPQLEGYIVKTYLDKYPVNKKNDADWLWLSRRCQLSRKIARMIKKHDIQNFTVPQKWLYPIPKVGLEDADVSERLNALLIAEEMPLLNEEENKLAWENISDEALDEFSDIMIHAGGRSYRPDNVWITENGTFAFIDTEYPHFLPRYFEVLPYLTEEKGEYWKLLVISKLLSQSAVGR